MPARPPATAAATDAANTMSIALSPTATAEVPKEESRRYRGAAAGEDHLVERPKQGGFRDSAAGYSRWIAVTGGGEWEGTLPSPPPPGGVAAGSNGW